MREKTEVMERILAEATLQGEARLKKLQEEQASVEASYSQRLIELRHIERSTLQLQYDQARINEELRQQIHLLEAKASPSNVWAEAFTSGFNKAWDMMAPLMEEGSAKVRQSIYDKGVNDTLKRLEGSIHAKETRLNGHALPPRQ